MSCGVGFVVMLPFIKFITMTFIGQYREHISLQCIGFP